MSFILLQVRAVRVVHGYDADDRERAETIEGEAFAPKLIALSRILSATERTLLVTGSHGRVMLWEYREGLAELTARLAAAGLVAPACVSAAWPAPG